MKEVQKRGHRPAPTDLNLGVRNADALTMFSLTMFSYDVLKRCSHTIFSLTMFSLLNIPFSQRHGGSSADILDGHPVALLFNPGKDDLSPQSFPPRSVVSDTTERMPCLLQPSRILVLLLDCPEELLRKRS